MASDIPQQTSLPLGGQIHSLLTALGIRQRTAVILVPYLWLTIFFVVPCIIILKISFAQTVIAQPPYTPMFGPDSVPHDQLFDNFKRLLKRVFGSFGEGGGKGLVVIERVGEVFACDTEAHDSTGRV